MMLEKKFPITPQKLLTLFILGPFYFLLLGGYFLLVQVAAWLARPFGRRLKVPYATTRLDGISIIIPTWNKKDLIVNCLRILDLVLTKTVKLPVEILVVENGSEDGSLEALEQLKLQTPMTILPQKKNLGFAPAINLAVQRAQFNYLYLLNNDMEAQETTFAEIIKCAEHLLARKITFFSIASQILFHDPEKRREESGKTYIAPHAGFLKVAHCVDPLNLQTDSLALYAGGGSSLFNKYLFLKLDGYDALSYRPLYAEDLDLGFIAWQLGWPSFYCAASKIIHHHRSSTKKLKLDPDFLIRKNFLVFIWKNFNSGSLIRAHLFLYPLLMFADEQYRRYFLTAVKNLPQILKQRLRLLAWHKIYSSRILIDFTKFELFYDQAKT